jgi:hypothetical protein
LISIELTLKKEKKPIGMKNESDTQTIQFFFELVCFLSFAFATYIFVINQFFLFSNLTDGKSDNIPLKYSDKKNTGVSRLSHCLLVIVVSKC